MLAPGKRGEGQGGEAGSGGPLGTVHAEVWPGSRGHGWRGSVREEHSGEERCGLAPVRRPWRGTGCCGRRQGCRAGRGLGGASRVPR